MTQTKCRECGCPHTTIHEHVVLNERFFLTERHCDNCDNIWTSLENQSPFREAEQTKKPTKKLEFSTLDKQRINNNYDMIGVVRDQVNDLESKHKEDIGNIMQGISKLTENISEEKKQLRLIVNTLEKIMSEKPQE